MLQATTVTFLRQLGKNNNKPWFDAHRTEYETAKADFEVFVQQLLDGVAVGEPVFKEQKPKDCIFRIFRDVRFSKDKTPYKPNFGAFFSKGGRKYPGAGYYVHIEPGGKSFAGGGLWQPETPILKSVRQEIDYNFAEFDKIVSDKKFGKLFGKVSGEQLKSLPQGYKDDNPAIEYLKMKSFVVMHPLDDETLTSKSFAKNTVGVFTAMRPFAEFLNRAV